jgi:phosphoribosyl-AMP cyclohydrolase
MEPALRAFFAWCCCERATFVARINRWRHDQQRWLGAPQYRFTEYPVLTTPLTSAERENGSTFAPKFDADGLLTAVVVDDRTGEVLVVAHMNDDALSQTLETGHVTFWSRSRQRLWMKGESSGNVLTVRDVLVDCDQDALVIRAQPAGPTCHTGATSCFYRRVERGESGVALVKVKT